jgi:tetratricopeptide (TPR) repeat protein
MSSLFDELRYRSLFFCLVLALGMSCNSKSELDLDLIAKHTLYATQGDQSFSKGDYEAAIKHYIESTKVARTIGGTKFFLLVSLSSLAKAYQGRKDFSHAESTYLDLATVLGDLSDTDKKEISVGDYYENIAVYYLQTEQYVKSKPWIEKSLNTLKAKYGVNADEYKSSIKLFSLLLKSKNHITEAEMLEKEFSTP